MKPIKDGAVEAKVGAEQPIAPPDAPKSTDWHAGWCDGFQEAQKIGTIQWHRMTIAAQVLAGFAAYGHNATGPDLAAKAWAWAGWLLDEAGK